MGSEREQQGGEERAAGTSGAIQCRLLPGVNPDRGPPTANAAGDPKAPRTEEVRKNRTGSWKCLERRNLQRVSQFGVVANRKES